MAKLGARDRLQPSLLDRLLDFEPASQQEPVEARALNRQQLRAAVLRDLAWLLNTASARANPAGQSRLRAADWDAAPEAARSVLNYGVQSLTGTSLSSVDIAELQQGIADAIRHFEPRIDGKTLEVELATHSDDQPNSLQILIRGQMWAQPMPLELMLSAQVDVETGTARVRDLRA
ncbi:MAG: type VI secretion system baseplate subunit TssE [Pseudomonadota bacterium]|nr:type VI secretion system baseplate subunit TssE [Pseudomonadota bacterium]